jgi:hypothetical protein
MSLFRKRSKLPDPKELEIYAPKNSRNPTITRKNFTIYKLKKD